MQMNMHFNKINPLMQNGIYTNGNIAEGMSENVFKSLLNAENKPLTAQLNKARTAFLASMLHKTIESSNGNIKQNKNSASKQNVLQKDQPVIKIAGKSDKPVEHSEVKQNPHNRLKQKLQFLAERYQEKPGNGKEQQFFSTVKPLAQKMAEKKDLPAKETSPVQFTSVKEASPTSYMRAGSQTDNQLVNNEKPIINQAPTNIDDFIKNLKDVTFNKDKILGKGSYGTAYRFGEFVIKVPIDSDGYLVKWGSGILSSASPKRVSKYLNMANLDESFSRVANIKFKGKDTAVLVSKYIDGSPIEEQHECKKALELLHDRGYHMHDSDVYGNIIKTKENKYYYIDADQIVAYSSKPRERKLSDATEKLENMLASRWALNLVRAQKNKDLSVINYLNPLIDTFEEATGITVQKRV